MFALAIALLFIGNTESFLAGGILCTRCDHATTWAECVDEECKSNENCHLLIHHGNNNGVKITAGCLPKHACPLNTITHHNHNAVRCESCCATDNCFREQCTGLSGLSSSVISGPSGIFNGLLNGNNNGGLDHCMNCNDNPTHWDCNGMEHCYAGQVCYVQQLESGQNTFYHGGCTERQYCGDISTYSHNSWGKVIHGACCSTNACNNLSLLQKKAHTTTEKATTKAPTTTPQPTTTTAQPTTTTTSLPTTTTTQPTTTTTQSTTRPPPVNYCMECRNQGVNWNCSSMTKCRPYEVCFVQELKFTVSVPSLPITYYHGGCISQSDCSKISHTSTENEHGLATVVQGQCCSSFDCNRHIMKKYKARVMCEVCQGPNCGPGSGTLSLCPVDSPLCMTTVVNDQHGHKEYTKRCASETECKQKWLNESILKSECDGFKTDSSYLFDFTCHYCCKTNGCNKDIVPSTETMYTGKH